MAEKLTRTYDEESREWVYRADAVDALLRSLWALVEETRADAAKMRREHIPAGHDCPHAWGLQLTADCLAARLPAPPPEEP